MPLNKISTDRAMLHMPEVREQVLPSQSVLHSIDFAEAFQDELLVTEGENFSVFYFILNVFSYLATLGLSCSVYDLLLHCTGSLVMAPEHVGLVALQHVESLFPNQGSNLHPLCCKVDS